MTSATALKLQTLPVLTSPEPGGCGTACGGGCGGGAARPAGTLTEIPFGQRRLNLEAVPSTGSYVQHIDLDLTVECNLRCTYCFKEKWTEHMEEQTAFDAMVWLIHASGPARSIDVSLMGGEPLLRFKLIKKLVPFAKRRAAQHGKRIHFSMTTNGTLVTDEVIAFWRRWGMGFHTSIDGTPEVQDRNRPTTGGRGSSRLVERSVPKILSLRPGTTARSTVVPETAGTLLEAYHYFRSLGYTDIAFVPGSPGDWDEQSLALYESQFNQVADAWVEDLRRGNMVNLKGVGEYIEGRLRGSRNKHACGAGRGLLLIDIHGDIWPCHRWNKQRQASWRIGSIYEQFNEAARSVLDQPDHTVLLEQDCPRCPAQNFCSGGCPAENLEATGSVYRRHHYSCELTRVWARAGQRVHDILFEERNPLFMGQYYAN